MGSYKVNITKQTVSKAKDHYDVEVPKLEKLMNKRDEIQKNGRMKPMLGITHGLSFIMALIRVDIITLFILRHGDLG